MGKPLSGEFRQIKRASEAQPQIKGAKGRTFADSEEGDRKKFDSEE
jgi:hypothetical protein